MANENLIKDIISRIRITEAFYNAHTKEAVGYLNTTFRLDFDKSHESCKWFKEQIATDTEIRNAIVDNLINRFAEPVDGYLGQIEDDKDRIGGFYADIFLKEWNDDECTFVLESEFPTFGG